MARQLDTILEKVEGLKAAFNRLAETYVATVDSSYTSLSSNQARIEQKVDESKEQTQWSAVTEGIQREAGDHAEAAQITTIEPKSPMQITFASAQQALAVIWGPRGGREGMWVRDMLFGQIRDMVRGIQGAELKWRDQEMFIQSGGKEGVDPMWQAIHPTGVG